MAQDRQKNTPKPNRSTSGSRMRNRTNNASQPSRTHRMGNMPGRNTSRARNDAKSRSAASSHANDRAYNRYSKEKYVGKRSEDVRKERSRYANHEQAQEQRRNRTVKKVLLIALAAVLVVFIAAWAYVSVLNSNLNRGIDNNLLNVLTKTDYTKEPFYMVLMGTDESLERDQDGSLEGTYRTDTILLARVDAVNRKITLVSMPRDTKVELGKYGTQKLNAAYALGGSSLAVEAVSDIADVDISHFALVDMDGLREVVDALGGIEVDVPITIDDEEAGGYLEAGLQTLSGEQALILCRSRNAYADYGGGDLYRAANQRVVLQAIASKMLASDAATIASTVQSLSNSVSTDFSVSDIVSLAQAFQGMDSEKDLYTASMPTESVYEDDLWYEEVLTQPWKKMMSRIDQGLAPTETTSVDDLTGTVLSNSGDGSASSSSVQKIHEGTVVVQNGSGVEGIGSTVATKLENVGYTVVDVENAESFDYQQTVVLYDFDYQEEEALGIVETLGEGTVLQNDGSYTVEEEYLVIIGGDLAN